MLDVLDFLRCPAVLGFVDHRGVVGRAGVVVEPERAVVRAPPVGAEVAVAVGEAPPGAVPVPVRAVPVAVRVVPAVAVPEAVARIAESQPQPDRDPDVGGVGHGQAAVHVPAGQDRVGADETTDASGGDAVARCGDALLLQPVAGLRRCVAGSAGRGPPRCAAGSCGRAHRRCACSRRPCCRRSHAWRTGAPGRSARGGSVRSGRGCRIGNRVRPRCRSPGRCGSARARSCCRRPCGA